MGSRGYRRARLAGVGAGAPEMWRAVLDRHGGAAPDGTARHVGEVVQVFDRSAYIELTPASGTDVLGPPLVLLCGDGFDGPLSTRIVPESGVPFRNLGVAVGDECRLRATAGTTRSAGGFVLSVGETLEVPLQPSALEPAAVTAGYDDVRSMARDGDVWTRGAELARWFASRDEEDGLGWAPDLLAAVEGEPPTDELASLAENWTGPLSRGEDAPGDGGLAVLGRGPGTTPSGDDILSGVLLTLHRTSRGPMRDTVYRLGEATVSAATGRTTTVSAALLAQAAQGRASGRVDSLLRALLVEPSDDGWERPAAELIDVGYTSGADLLLGLLVAVLLICPAVESGATR